MRLSTSVIYNTSVTGLNRQQSSLVQLQQQLSTGKRVVAPSDDPVAAARALEIEQALSRLTVEKDNQGAATDQLKNLDSQLGSVSDVLNYIRERAVQAGNASLSAEDKSALVTDLKAQFDALMALANTRDQQGDYLFSGFQGNTQPFTGNLNGVSYQGDQGERTVQITSNRSITVSVSGNDLFMNIGSVNGSFSTSGSSATAVISDGTVTGPATYDRTPYAIRFTSATTYDVFDTSADPSMSGTPLGSGTYTSGSAISLPPGGPAQIEVAVSGAPVTGDVFRAEPGNTKDMFSSVQQLIVGLENTTGADYDQVIADALGQLDKSLENVSRVRSDVGSRMVEVEAVGNLGDSMKVQYTDRMEELVGLDYAQAISDFSLQQTYLQAAQTTFSKISSLSLFNYLK